MFLGPYDFILSILLNNFNLWRGHILFTLLLYNDLECLILLQLDTVNMHTLPLLLKGNSPDAGSKLDALVLWSARHRCGIVDGALLIRFVRYLDSFLINGYNRIGVSWLLIFIGVLVVYFNNTLLFNIFHLRILLVLVRMYWYSNIRLCFGSARLVIILTRASRILLLILRALVVLAGVCVIPPCLLLFYLVASEFLGNGVGTRPLLATVLLIVIILLAFGDMVMVLLLTHRHNAYLFLCERFHVLAPVNLLLLELGLYLLLVWLELLNLL